MGLAKYVVNGIDFSSIEGIRDHCRQIIKRATGPIHPERGIRFTLPKEDEDFILDMVYTYHANGDDVIGVGLDSVQIGYVGPEIGRPHWGFYAIRIDGSEDLFGFGKICKNKEKIQVDRIKDAKRKAIASQVIEYKEQYFDGFDTAICEATGEEMTRTTCHVDHHEPTFAELDKAYFKGQEVELSPDGFFWEIKDSDLRLGWQEYHRQNAKLRCVTARFNLTRKGSA